VYGLLFQIEDKDNGKMLEGLGVSGWSGFEGFRLEGNQ